MKALVAVVALALLAFPATAAPIEAMPDLFDQLFGWLIAVWEAIGPMIDPSGSPETAAPPCNEIGPMIDPSGSPEACEG